MSNKGTKVDPGEGWLREENPDLYYMVQALAGDVEALRWLELKSEGLWLFTRAAGGDRKALAALEAGQAIDLDDLFGTIDDPGLWQWLAEKHADLHLLFQSIKGDDDALRRLKRKKAVLARLALLVGAAYQKHQNADADGTPEDARPAESPQEIPGDAAADVGCLIGELHLSKGDYAKAVEAFSRSIETDPSADAYEGRAHAYRELALADERKALELREKTGPAAH